MMQAIQSLYSNVKCAVKVNNYTTEWFDVAIGLKQGCLLSTTMFNLYINDLSEILNQSNSGIFINGANVNHLFYADDLVLMVESETDLQYLLSILANWCTNNKMTINLTNTKMMHFRNPSTPRTDVIFKCNDHNFNRMC